MLSLFKIHVLIALFSTSLALPGGIGDMMGGGGLGGILGQSKDLEELVGIEDEDRRRVQKLEHPDVQPMEENVESVITEMIMILENPKEHALEQIRIEQPDNLATIVYLLKQIRKQLLGAETTSP